MTKTPLTLAAATLFGSLILGAGSASALPMVSDGLHADRSGIVQVQMTHGERMMMRRRMMRKRMMRHRMMRHHMMHRM